VTSRSTRDAATATVVCSVDAAYTLPLLVTLASLRAELPTEQALHVHVVHSGLPVEHLEAIAALVDVTPVAFPQPLRASIPAHRRFPPQAAVPLLVGELLPKALERVVFVDADLLVIDDPSELFEADLAGRAFGAVVDGAIVRCSAPRGVRGWRGLGIPPSAAYFNAGVIVIDLPTWRARDVGGRAMRYLELHVGGGGFLHQEALNAIAWEDWAAIDPRWNVLASHIGRTRSATRASPGIVHFAGRVKPWRVPVTGPLGERYRAVLGEVASLVAPGEPRLRDRALAAYDRRLRGLVFPLEHALWKRGLI
jgi:lipopolysaccharide biosynthesis glycosyltransferase